jgi:hypothetical protein
MVLEQESREVLEQESEAQGPPATQVALRAPGSK